jgi:hypothetical protein
MENISPGQSAAPGIMGPHGWGNSDYFHALDIHERVPAPVCTGPKVAVE